MGILNGNTNFSRGHAESHRKTAYGGQHRGSLRKITAYYVRWPGERYIVTTTSVLGSNDLDGSHSEVTSWPEMSRIIAQGTTLSSNLGSG